jgi:redox-sensitive bicupin YhaK (pirin superfamily)
VSNFPPQAHPSAKVISARSIQLTTRTGVEVHRLFPQAGFRKIGAWCFMDHFGPTPQDDAMVVAAHPHTGLQTATWLIDGAVEHRDSIGNVQTLLPGELNLMTAGKGIAHSELGVLETDPAHPNEQQLHAVQLWIALPESARHMAPTFEHHANLPRVVGRGFSAKVFVGEFHGAVSPATTFSPLVGVQLSIDAAEPVIIPLHSEFEHGILALTGGLFVDGKRVEAGQLIYLPVGDGGVTVHASRPGTQAMLVGGAPFEEHLVMWWNFIGRTHSEIVEMRRIWNQRGSESAPELHASEERFGAVFTDRVGGWIPAPELPNVELRSR